jgi:hypothetical protein
VDKGLAVLLTAVAGGLIALQAPINAGLGRSTGSLPAALVSFAIGTIALAAIVVLSGKVGGLSSTFDVSWYYLLGGFLGAIYVTNALIAVSVVGAWQRQRSPASSRLRSRSTGSAYSASTRSRSARSASPASSCFWPAPFWLFAESSANRGGAICR